MPSYLALWGVWNKSMEVWNFWEILPKMIPYHINTHINGTLSPKWYQRRTKSTDFCTQGCQ